MTETQQFLTGALVLVLAMLLFFKACPSESCDPEKLCIFDPDTGKPIACEPCDGRPMDWWMP